MKFYETHYEEYLHSLDQYNMHPELIPIYHSYPRDMERVGNTIFYGPTGAGKYTQLLQFIRRYSPSGLKYDKKIRLQTDKTTYIYRISDIHYEIDMSLLGCNSKLLWHELFFQIIDIISMKTDKAGIIVCKNFHMIHNELLEVFYSYIQQCKLLRQNLHVCIWILTENVSFLPNKILDCCDMIRVQRPSKETYANMMKFRIQPTHRSRRAVAPQEETFTWKEFVHKTTTTHISVESMKHPNTVSEIMEHMDESCILNAKELHSFSLMDSIEEFPKDIFNIICDNIIKQLLNPTTLEFTEFRDHLYDILVYNLEITECLWYILHYLVQNGYIQDANRDECMQKIHLFLKQYNNNYRPIYHLESIFFYFITQIHPEYNAYLPCHGIVGNHLRDDARTNETAIQTQGAPLSSR